VRRDKWMIRLAIAILAALMLSGGLGKTTPPPGFPGNTSPAPAATSQAP
jgi:hypothetical protein